MRFLLTLLWSIVSLLVLALVVVTVLLTVFNDEVEAKLVEKIELNTGRNVEIQGGFGFRFNPRPTFFAKDIKMANADWASRPWMLEIDSLEASLSLSGLLHGEVQLSQVYAQKPKIWVEKNAALATQNWAFGKPREPKVFKRLADHLRIYSARVDNAEIRLDLGQKKTFIELSRIEGNTHYFNQSIDLIATGEMNGELLTIEAQLSTLKNMLLREPTNIEFKANFGSNTLTGQGEIQDLMRWQGHDIKLSMETPSLDALQAWASNKLMQTPKIKATARFIQTKKWPSARFEKINITSQALAGETMLKGRVARLQGWQGIDLSGEAHYPLAEIIRWKGKESSTDAMIDARFSLIGDKADSLALEIQSAILSGKGLQMEGKGRIAHILLAETEGIPFTVHLESLAQLNSMNNKRFFNTGAIDGKFMLKKKDSSLALDEIQISTFKQRLKLSGELDKLPNAQIGRFDLSANLVAEDIALINRLNTLKLPVFESTVLSGKVISQKAHIELPVFSASQSTKGLTLSAKGSITELKTLNINRAKLILKSNSVDDINQQFEMNLPALGKVELSGNLEGDIKNKFKINKIEGFINNSDQFFSIHNGRLNALGEDLKSAFDIGVDIRSLNNLPALLKSDINISGKLKGKGSAQLTSENLKDWSLSDIKVSVAGDNQGKILGSVKHFPASPEYALVADLKRISTKNLPKNKFIDDLKPENISAYAELNKTADAAHFSLNNIDGQFTLATGEASINIAGQVNNINQLKGLDVSFGLSSTDLDSIPYLQNLPFKENISGLLSVNLKGEPKQLEVNILKSRIGESDIQGQLNLVQANGENAKPRLTGGLVSNNLDVLALIKKQKRTRLFSESKIDLKALNDIDIKVSLDAKRFNGVIMQLADTHIDLIIENGVLNMPDMQGRAGAGNMAMWLTIDARQQPYNIVVTLKGDEIKPDHLNLFGQSQLIKGGTIDADIGLAGSGDSMASFMDHAFGKIQLQFHDTSLKNQNLELFGSDLLLGVLGVINPLKSDENNDYLPIECGVIHFPVVNGDAVASQGIAIKTDKVTVLGGGAIDLGSEELELLIKPKARKGLGISFGTSLNLAKVSGSFAKPKFSANSNALLQTTAAIGAAIASGGWTLLAQGLLDRTKANSDVCNQTLLKPNTKFLQFSVNPFEEERSSDQ